MTDFPALSYTPGGGGGNSANEMGGGGGGGQRKNPFRGGGMDNFWNHKI